MTNEVHIAGPMVEVVLVAMLLVELLEVLLLAIMMTLDREYEVDDVVAIGIVIGAYRYRGSKNRECYILSDDRGVCHSRQDRC